MQKIHPVRALYDVERARARKSSSPNAPTWKTTFPKLHGTALFPEIARVQHLGYTGIALGLRRFFQSALSLDSASENRDSTEIARDRAVVICVAAQISHVSLTHAGSRQNAPTHFTARARIAQCLMGGISMRKVTGSIPRGGEYFEKCPGTATIRGEARKHF